MLGLFDRVLTDIKDRRSQNYGKQLNVESDIIRRNIDASNQRQAEIDIQRAAAQSVRSDIDLDAWNTIIKSGTTNTDYIQPYLQGQLNRDFKNPNMISPNNVLIGVLVIVFFFVFVMIVVLSKSRKKDSINIPIES